MVTTKMGLGLMLGMLLLAGNACAESTLDMSGSPTQGQQQNQGKAQGGGRIPPDSAISACSGKSEATACEFIGHNGAKQGVCAYTPDKKYYACKPNDMNVSSPPAQR